MVSKTKVRRAQIGEFTVDFPYFSHWKFADGKWWWYLPQASVRKTPFGDMATQPRGDGANGDNLHAMIQQGAKLDGIQRGVQVDKTRVALPDSLKSEVAVNITNHLNGPVKVILEPVQSKIFSASLLKPDLGAGQTVPLTITRVGSGAPRGLLTLQVEPTGQSITIEIQ
jgi:hypothetical protein